MKSLTARQLIIPFLVVVIGICKIVYSQRNVAAKYEVTDYANAIDTYLSKADSAFHFAAPYVLGPTDAATKDKYVKQFETLLKKYTDSINLIKAPTDEKIFLQLKQSALHQLTAEINAIRDEWMKVTQSKSADINPDGTFTVSFVTEATTALVESTDIRKKQYLATKDSLFSKYKIQVFRFEPVEMPVLPSSPYVTPDTSGIH